MVAKVFILIILCFYLVYVGKHDVAMALLMVIRVLLGVRLVARVFCET